MWRASRRLISSTSAASVVVLPEPVGPPMRTSPRGSCASSSTAGGRPSVARRGTRVGSSRTAAAARPRSRCRLIAEAAEAGDAERGVGDARLAILPPRVRRQRRQHRLLDVEAVERPFGERDDLAVDANRRRRAGHEQQVAAVARGQQPQPPFEPAAVPHRRRQARLDSRMQLEDQALDVVGVGHGGILAGVQGSEGSRFRHAFRARPRPCTRRSCLNLEPEP